MADQSAPVVSALPGPFSPTSQARNSARGIDRYASSLSDELGKTGIVDVRIKELQKGLPCPVFPYVLSELAAPFRLLGTKADVYHAVAPFVAKSAIAAFKSPLVTTFHDLIPFRDAITHFHVESSRHDYFYSRAVFRLAARSRLVIVPFEITKRDMIKTLGVAVDKIRVVPLGVDTEFFSPRDAESLRAKAGGKKIVLSILGDICEQKGLSFLLRSFASLCRDVPSELWIGGKWVDRPLFDRLMEELRLEGNVKLIGYVPEEDLPHYYSAANICVLPSRQGFSLPVLESMACGTPVVAPNTADIREIIENEDLLVDPTNVTRLAEAMGAVVAHRDIDGNMRRQTRDRAQRYSWSKVARETIKVYQEMCI